MTLHFADRINHRNLTINLSLIGSVELLFNRLTQFPPFRLQSSKEQLTSPDKLLLDDYRVKWLIQFKDRKKKKENEVKLLSSEAFF